MSFLVSFNGMKSKAGRSKLSMNFQSGKLKNTPCHRQLCKLLGVLKRQLMKLKIIIK